MVDNNCTKKLVQDVIDSIETARKAPWETDLLLTRLVIRLELLRDMISAFPSYDAERVIDAFVGKSVPTDALNFSVEEKKDAE